MRISTKITVLDEHVAGRGQGKFEEGERSVKGEHEANKRVRLARLGDGGFSEPNEEVRRLEAG